MQSQERFSLTESIGGLHGGRLEREQGGRKRQGRKDKKEPCLGHMAGVDGGSRRGNVRLELVSRGQGLSILLHNHCKVLETSTRK